MRNTIYVIHNLSEAVLSDETLVYIVARCVDQQLWFWGAFRDSLTAQSVALQVDGAVFLRFEVDLKGADKNEERD